MTSPKRSAPASTTTPATTEVPRGRAPQQSRGHQRVAVILDCAAAIVASEGLASLTMHSLAKRAKTSIGSLYHFFPDRECVRDALAERHGIALQAITDGLAAITDDAWRQLAPESTIEKLLLPYCEYVGGHPDFLPVMGDPKLVSHAAAFQHLIGKVLALRLPETTDTQRKIFSEMLHAIAAGTIQFAYQTSPAQLDIWLVEVQRALAAYLVDVETRSSEQAAVGKRNAGTHKSKTPRFEQGKARTTASERK